MADEARITCSLQITKGNLSYQSRPTQFTADVSGTFGPTPGAISVGVLGEHITLEGIVTPGFCRIQNLDDTNYVEFGIYDVTNSQFFPLGEVGPGEVYVLKLSRNLFEEYVGTGTGTGAAENYFHLKANTAACNVVLEVFER